MAKTRLSRTAAGGTGLAGDVRFEGGAVFRKHGGMAVRWRGRVHGCKAGRRLETTADGCGRRGAAAFCWFCGFLGGYCRLPVAAGVRWTKMRVRLLLESD